MDSGMPDLFQGHFVYERLKKDYENLDGIAGNSAGIRSAYHLNLILGC